MLGVCIDKRLNFVGMQAKPFTSILEAPSFVKRAVLLDHLLDEPKGLEIGNAFNVLPAVPNFFDLLDYC